MAGIDDIDIFDNPFRDPVYEELGFIFDPERNQYYEVIEDPEYGAIRRYYSPRDREPVPELSDARIAFDEQLAREDMARYLAQLGELGPSLSSRIGGRVTDRDMDRFGRFKMMPRKRKFTGSRAADARMKRLIEDIGLDPNASGGVGDLEMDFFRRSR